MNIFARVSVANVFNLLLLLLLPSLTAYSQESASVVGVTVVPHRIEENMRYKRSRDSSLAAKVQVFVQGPALPNTFDGKTPAELLESGDWAWHDMASTMKPPEGAMTVWSFNGKSSRWGVGESFKMVTEGIRETSIEVSRPLHWISAANFLSSDGNVQPDTICLHLANETDTPLSVTGLRLWLPQSGATWQILWPQEVLPIACVVPSMDRGFVKM